MKKVGFFLFPREFCRKSASRFNHPKVLSLFGREKYKCCHFTKPKGHLHFLSVAFQPPISKCVCISVVFCNFTKNVQNKNKFSKKRKYCIYLFLAKMTQLQLNRLTVRKKGKKNKRKENRGRNSGPFFGCVSTPFVVWHVDGGWRKNKNSPSLPARLTVWAWFVVSAQQAPVLCCRLF